MTTTSRMVFTASVTLAVAAGNARGQICASHPDGPDVCARRFVFGLNEPLSDPVLNTDWEVDYSSNPGSPDVRLLIGDVRFQVWSHVPNQSTIPADIGTITVNQTTGYDYELKLRNPSGSAGAASVGSIVLTPPGPHLTKIVGESYISGALEDELTLESAALNSYAGLVVGTLAGTITVPGEADIMVLNDVQSGGSIVVNRLTSAGGSADEIVVMGDVSGSIVVQDVMDGGRIEIDGDLKGAAAEISVRRFLRNATVEIHGACEGAVELNENWVGSLQSQSTTAVSIGRLAGTGKLDFNTRIVDGDITLLEGGAPGSLITGITLLFPNARVELNQSESDSFEGTLSIGGTTSSSVIQAQNFRSPGVITMGGHSGSINTAVDPDDLTSGTVSITGSCAGTVSMKRLASNGAVTIGGDLSGSVGFLGTDTSYGPVSVGGDLTGSVYAADSLSGNITIVGDIDATFGVVTVEETFDGDLCAANIVPGQALPTGVQVATWGDASSLCGAPTCPGGDADCDDEMWCSLEECQNLACIVSCEERTYGDLNVSGSVTLDDILAVMAAFGGTYTNCANGVRSGCDVWNTFEAACEPQDGYIQNDDILKVIAAFGGDYACPSPCDCGGDSAAGGPVSGATGPVDAARQVIEYLAGAGEASDLDESGLALLAELLGVWCNMDLSADERTEVAAIASEAIGSASSDVNVDILAKLVEQLD